MSACQAIPRSVLLILAFSGLAHGQSPRVLYTWAWTGNAQGWTLSANFGVNTVTVEQRNLGVVVETILRPILSPARVTCPCAASWSALYLERKSFAGSES